MKLTLEDRLKIIELYEQGYSKSQLSKKFRVNSTTIERIENQYRTHGIESFKEKGNNNKYTADFKYAIIQRIFNGESITGLACELCIYPGVIWS